MKKALYFLLGLAILPLCGPALWTLWQCVRVLLEGPVRLSAAPAVAAVSGAAAAVVLIRLFGPWTKTYVLGHELTHALFALLCLSRPRNIHVGDDGGQVTVKKSNFLIALSPYFFPFYTALAAGAWALAAWWVPAMHAQAVSCSGLFLVAGTWVFHLAYTVKFLRVGQPDVKTYGRLFSYALILLLNTVFLALALTLAGSWSFREALGWGKEAWRWQAALAMQAAEWMQARLLSR
ncbi:MAG: hypothetical protein IJS32_00410 [Kiritimatiellae bacterium]|nr:hypothetical protein [Kiritimatiellia bacterium]